MAGVISPCSIEYTTKNTPAKLKLIPPNQVIQLADS